VITINQATEEDLAYVGSWLCDDDRQELACTRDQDDYMSLARDAGQSTVCKVALDDGLPVMAFGARTIPATDVALVWGFKTVKARPAIPSVTKYIRRIMIPALRSLGVRHGVCIVHPENKASQDWLRLLGYTPRATSRDIGTQEVIIFQYDDPPDA
jgi:hypothetical protein